MEAARLARLARPEVKSVRCVVVGDKLDSAKTKLLVSYTTVMSSEDYISTPVSRPIKQGTQKAINTLGQAVSYMV